MSTEKSEYTWSYWLRRRLEEQFHDDANFHRTAFLIPLGVFLGTWRITNSSGNAVTVAGLSAIIFPLYSIMRRKGPPIGVRERKIDLTASELNEEEILNVTEIEELQELVSDQIFGSTLFDACVIWDCKCADVKLFREKMIRYQLKTSKGEEKFGKCPHCNVSGDFAIVEDQLMRKIVKLMKGRQWDDVKIYFDEEILKSTPMITKEGDTCFIQGKEEAPEGSRIHQPFLNLMNYVKGGGLLASKEI